MIICHLLPQANAQLEQSDTKAIQLGQKVSSLEAQLADSQDISQEETRQKLALQSKLRQAEDEKENALERLEEEEEAKRALEKQVADLNQKVGGLCVGWQRMPAEQCGPGFEG